MLPAYPARPHRAAPQHVAAATEQRARASDPDSGDDLNALLDAQPEPWSGAGWTREEVCAYREADRKAHRTAPMAGVGRVAERPADPYGSPDDAVRRALVTLLRSAPRDSTLLRDLARGWRESLAAARSVRGAGPAHRASG